jgi:hypothetical protein
MAAAATPIELLAEHGAGGFPHLLAARERTEAALGELRGRLAGLDRDPDAAVVLFGSWGRRELTEHSDDDWLLLVDGAPRDATAPGLHALRERLGGGAREPGGGRIFGVTGFGDDLVDHIGLDEDDNRNLTQRMLLMLESVPILGEDAYASCWTRVLDRYLAEERGARRPPRFFLNDVIRYWRTIAVDFAGKQRDSDEKWALRNAKLRTSRKVLFAGGLVPILRCHNMPREAVRPFLIEQLERPATDRLADAFLAAGLHDAGVRCLSAYDRWLGLLGDAGVRAELAALDRRAARDSETFVDVRRLAADLQNGLLALLFETPLAPAVREYAIF